MGHHDRGFLCSEAASGVAGFPSELAALHPSLRGAVAQKYPFSLLALQAAWEHFSHRGQDANLFALLIPTLLFCALLPASGEAKLLPSAPIPLVPS